jgi:large subunit ribosomal protein L4
MANTVSLEVSVVDSSNAEVGKVSLPGVFGAPVNDALLFEQVLSQMASRRSGSASTKTRGKVRGGGAKPWKQKGTGRARAGSNRSPIWRGGGTTFGPEPRSYAYRMPRKARRAALASALAQKARDGQVRVIESFGISEPRTRRMREILDALGIGGSVVIVSKDGVEAIGLSARNLPRVTATTVAGLNVYDLLRHDILLLTRDTLEAVQERTED